jgi:hypothetical protein
MFRMVEGLGFYTIKPGIMTIDIVPYKAGVGNPYCQQPGELYYERTFWRYVGLGPERNNYVAVGKTFKKKDFVQDYRGQINRDPNGDHAFAKTLEPKERQIFLVLDHEDNELKLWEVAPNVFGNLLDTRVAKAPEDLTWDLFYFPDEEGSSLRLTVGEQSVKDKDGRGFSFNKVEAIDFIPRGKALPEAIANHGICLDDMLIEVPYEQMKAIMLGEEYKKEPSNDEPSDPEGSGGRPVEDVPPAGTVVKEEFPEELPRSQIEESEDRAEQAVEAVSSAVEAASSPGEDDEDDWDF